MLRVISIYFVSDVQRESDEKKAFVGYTTVRGWVQNDFTGFIRGKRVRENNSNNSNKKETPPYQKKKKTVFEIL